MKMFKSYYHKNILKDLVFLQHQNHAIWSFFLNNNFVQKNNNI